MPKKIQNSFRSLVIGIVTLLIIISLSIFLFAKLSDHQQKETANQIPPSTVENLQVTEPTSSVITLKISSPDKLSSYEIPTKKSLSVVDIMKIAESQGMTLKTKDYGASLGLLIESINGVPNDSKNQKYWTLYVNDKMSVTGASSTTVNPGETVTWKFENTTL